MTLKILKRAHLLILLILLSLLLFKAYFYVDYDFGWYLQSGRYIQKFGIPKTDIFSYTMPTFPFFTLEWLTNLLIAIFYDNSSYFMLSGFFVLILFLTFLITDKIIGEQKYQQVGQIIFLGIVVHFFGIRTQIVSWLYLAITLLILLNHKYQKFIYFYPLLMLLWANTHGSFPLGLMIYGLFIVGTIYQNKYINKSLLLIFFISILTTLINPHRQLIWLDVAQTITNNDLRWHIAEWLPSIYLTNIPMIALFSTSTLLTYKYHKLFDPQTLLIYTFLLAMAISGSRHLPLWALIAVPMLTKSVNLLRKEAKSSAKFKTGYFYFYLLIVLIVFMQFLAEIKIVNNMQHRFYPSPDAINVLRTYLTQNENYFSYYGWGGYLIWKFPEKKVFINGQMPVWRRTKELTLPNELEYAFRTYNQMPNNTSLRREVFDKYNINLVIWPNEKSAITINSVSGLFKTQQTNLLKGLQEEGWRKVYEDKTAIIYQRQGASFNEVNN